MSPTAASTTTNRSTAMMTRPARMIPGKAARPHLVPPTPQASRPYDTVWGRLVIGGKETYRIDRQFLYPMVISEIRGGKIVDIEQVLPAALKALTK